MLILKFIIIIITIIVVVVVDVILYLKLMNYFCRDNWNVHMFPRDEELIQRIGAVTALEARAAGINYTFAPCVAVSSIDSVACSSFNHAVPHQFF